jgi:hypothetical protein
MESVGLISFLIKTTKIKETIFTPRPLINSVTRKQQKTNEENASHPLLSYSIQPLKNAQLCALIFHSLSLSLLIFVAIPSARATDVCCFPCSVPSTIPPCSYCSVCGCTGGPYSSCNMCSCMSFSKEGANETSDASLVRQFAIHQKN